MRREGAIKSGRNLLEELDLRGASIRMTHSAIKM